MLPGPRAVGRAPCSGAAPVPQAGSVREVAGAPMRSSAWCDAAARSSAAEAPAVAPDAPPAWTEVTATPAPGSAMPSRSASAGDRGHVGWRHRLCAHRGKRLGIVRCERDHQPQAGCCKQNGLLHALSPLISFCRPARRKALSAAKRNRSRRPRTARDRRLRYCTNEGCMGNGGAWGEQFCTDRRRQTR